MKKNYFLLLLLTISSLTFGQVIWINEIHYDNASTDTAEGFEIAGPAGFNLSGYYVELYNGSNGEVYNTIDISTATIPDQSNGLGTVWFAVPGIQNGAPDGIAIVDGSGLVLQFLSYEGTLTATNGAAIGTTSTDLGVAENGSTAAGTSMQLTGSGNQYSDFTWETGLPATPDAPASTQVLSVEKNNIEGFEIYPNPVRDGQFTITTLDNEVKQVSIYNVLGKLVVDKTMSGTETQVNVSNLNTGVYILRLTQNNQIATRKLVIK